MVQERNGHKIAYFWEFVHEENPVGRPFVTNEEGKEDRAGASITREDEDVSIHETTQTLKAQISNLVRNSWNATCFMEENRKTSRRQGIRKLWADDILTNFDPKKGLEVDYT